MTMNAARPPVPRTWRLLIHDPDDARAAAIAHRARAGGHLVAVESAPEGLRRALLEGTWDALAIEILGGEVASPFVLLELRHALRRRGRPMPPAVVYVRDVLAGHLEAIGRLIDELGTEVECVRTQDPDRVVRALERAASGPATAAITIVRAPDSRLALDGPRRPIALSDAAQAPAADVAGSSAEVAGSTDPASVSPVAPRSPASNWSR
jgi:hypothetical protein